MSQWSSCPNQKQHFTKSFMGKFPTTACRLSKIPSRWISINMLQLTFVYILSWLYVLSWLSLYSTRKAENFTEVAQSLREAFSYGIRYILLCIRSYFIESQSRMKCLTYRIAQSLKYLSSAFLIHPIPAQEAKRIRRVNSMNQLTQLGMHCVVSDVFINEIPYDASWRYAIV